MLLTDLIDERDARKLDEFKTEHDDSAASDHDLVCQQCRTTVCTVEIGDTLASLVYVALTHVCGETDDDNHEEED